MINRGQEAVAQIDELAEFIATEFPSESSGSDEAVDTVVHLLREYKRNRPLKTREQIRKAIRNLRNPVLKEIDHD